MLATTSLMRAACLAAAESAALSADDGLCAIALAMRPPWSEPRHASAQGKGKQRQPVGRMKTQAHHALAPPPRQPPPLALGPGVGILLPPPPPGCTLMAPPRPGGDPPTPTPGAVSSGALNSALWSVTAATAGCVRTMRASSSATAGGAPAPPGPWRSVSDAAVAEASSAAGSQANRSRSWSALKPRQARPIQHAKRSAHLK